MSVQLPFPQFLPESHWELSTDFPDLRGKGCKWIGIDCETSDPFLQEKGPGFIRGDSFIAGWSIYAEGGHHAYYPVRHATGPNIAPNVVAEYMREQLGGNEPKIFANAPYDLEAMWSDGVKDVGGKIYDIQIAEPLIDEERFSYGLDELSKKYLGAGKEEDLLNEVAALYSRGGKRNGRGNIPFHTKKDLWLLDAKYVAPYALADSLKTVKVFECQEKLIDDQGLREIFELETSLLPVFLRMRRKGIAVDLEAAHKLANELTLMIDAIKLKIRALVGFEVNVDAPQKIRLAYETLNDKLVDKIEFKYTAIGNASFDKEWLEAQSDPLSALLLEQRHLGTLKDDFVVGDVIGEAHNGRIHSQWQQMRSADRGTRTGRVSSNSPNLQQVPKRDKVWGPKIRSLFVADRNTLFFKGDMAQQEPRLLLHFAMLCGLPGAADAVETFRKDPHTDYHAYTLDICNANSSRHFVRDEVKAVTLGVMYTMGIDKLCRQLKVSKPSGTAILENFHAALPFVKGLSNKAMTTAQDRGTIKTLLGRVSHFNLWEPMPESREARGERHRGLPRAEAEAKWPGRRLQRWGTHKALNRLIQGSAADQVKKAMAILYYEHGRVPQLQVHDELGASVEDRDEGRTYKYSMEHAVELVLPVVCEAKVGPSWGNAKEVLA